MTSNVNSVVNNHRTEEGGGKGGANSLTVLGTQTVSKNEMGLGWGEAHKKKHGGLCARVGWGRGPCLAR